MIPGDWQEKRPREAGTAGAASDEGSTARVASRGGEPARPRHLLDPADLRGSHQRSQGSAESLSRVQMWVMSVLMVTTLEHLAGGVAVVAVFTDDARLDARIGLNVIAAVIGCLAVLAGRMIHKRSPLSWWLLAGPLPGLVGAWFTFT